MKTVVTAAVSAALAAVAAPALAQTTGYATAGYNHLDAGAASLGEVQGRMGLRFGRHIGVEGELAQGVKGDEMTVGGVRTDIKAQPSAAAYGVAYLPVGERADVFARVGYGTSRFRTTAGPVSNSDTDPNVNYGVGAQYFVTDKDGVRVDYTRKTFSSSREDIDSYGVSYVRRF